MDYRDFDTYEGREPAGGSLSDALATGFAVALGVAGLVYFALALFGIGS